MSNRQAASPRQAQPADPIFILRLDVRMRQTRQDCWLYTWEREQGHLRLSGRQPGQDNLPADLAVLRLENQAEIPVYVLTPHSLMPGALVPVRVLGALQAPLSPAQEATPFPCAGWVLLAVPDLSDIPALYERLEQLAPAAWTALRRHACAQLLSTSIGPDELQVRPAEEVARVLRAGRLWLRRARRQAAPGNRPARRSEEEPVVAWRAVEDLSEEQRAQIAQARTLTELAPLLQAEHLIRFVPARFQQALQQVLLDDERVLAFLERPLLRHRSGWLGRQQYRANAGLFLLTDRQALWLRDFFSPGASAFPEGYIAHSLPLERLTSVQVLPAGTLPPEAREASPQRSLPYLQLCLRTEGRDGQEAVQIAFPDNEISAKVLVRLVGLLQAFLPCATSGSTGCQDDRRVRRLPVVEAWMPRGAEARRLQNLGGVIPMQTRQALEYRLTEMLHASGEELLASALVPALEQYRSPARLVALIRAAILVLETPAERTRGRTTFAGDTALLIRRYDLAQISSAQLSYSLLGSELRLFVPRPDDEAQQVIIPFQSPALAWFLPLFTRLRLALSVPVPLAQQGQDKRR
jgi:hypothetical protein